ncbi:RNA-directed DNA polymerase, eukaryota, partial [Tanacetum coccineum]
MDDPNITMEEYIRLKEEKARRHGKVYNWKTATYGKIWYDEDVHDLIYVKTELRAIVYNDALTSEVALSYEPTALDRGIADDADVSRRLELKRQLIYLTRWIKAMPIKINIFAWRARKDCLPTRMNLVQRDINIDSVLCPVCVTNDEDAHHLFFRCDLAQHVLRRLCRWWDIDTYGWSSFHDWLSWFSTI